MSLATTSWGWNASRSELRRPERCAWLKPLSVAVPWITVGLLLLMLYMIGGTFTATRGVLFDLPGAAEAVDGATAKLVALVIPAQRTTLVFFDDARYVLDDDASLAEFARQIEDYVRRDEKTLLVLADRRVAGGDLMKLASVVRRSGIARILFAERKETESVE